jgi:hypothetical protein
MLPAIDPKPLLKKFPGRLQDNRLSAMKLSVASTTQTAPFRFNHFLRHPESEARFALSAKDHNDSDEPTEKPNCLSIRALMAAVWPESCNCTLGFPDR